MSVDDRRDHTSSELPPEDIALIHDRLYCFLDELALMRKALADRADARAQGENALRWEAAARLHAAEHSIGPTNRRGSIELRGVLKQLSAAADLLTAVAETLGGWEGVYGTELYYGPDGRGYECWYDWTGLPGGPWRW